MGGWNDGTLGCWNDASNRSQHFRPRVHQSSIQHPESSIQDSIPPPLHDPIFFAPPGGEIESRLAYTQKSEGQNLPGRRQPIWKVRAVS